MKNLQNSDCPFHFLLKEIHLCSRQLRRLHFYKPLSGSSVAILRLAYSKISLPISEKKLERGRRRGWTQYKLTNGVTTLAQLCVWYSDRARFFNQWQRALHLNYIYNYLRIPMLLIRSCTKGIPQRLRLPGFSFKFAYCVIIERNTDGFGPNIW